MHPKEPTPKTLKLLVLGYTGSGKTTAAELLCSANGWVHANVSDFLITEYCRAKGIPISEVRRNKDKYRGGLFEYGREHQLVDPLWGVKGAMAMCGANVLTGVRNPDELARVRRDRIFDAILWIDRDGCTAGSTDKLSPTDADLIVLNSGTLEYLSSQLQVAVRSLQVEPPTA